MQLPKGDQMQATLNVRMDSVLKERGDKVLRDNGVSVSDAVRSLWKHLAHTHALPDFLAADTAASAEAERKRKLASFKKLVAIAASEPSPFAKLSDDELRAMQYEDMWREYMELR